MSMNLVKRVTSSLRGHIVLSEVLFSLPLFLVFLFQSYFDGALTLEWGIYLAVLWAASGVLGAVCLWYLVSLPLIKSRNLDRQTDIKRRK
jgi:hypothetical protein